MKAKIIYGPHTDEVIQKCYQYIISIYLREKLLGTLDSEKSEEKGEQINDKNKR